MLTHTCLLQQIMNESDIRHSDPDIYIYNIAPDLLTIHPGISANQTHSIPRFIEPPQNHRRVSYVMFHLLVDDLAHYGNISMACHEGFDPHSSGYTYLKGRRLIESIINLHKMIERDITYSEAAYRSHLIIEMIYDLVILSRIEKNNSIELLEEAVHFTLNNKAEEFCSDIAWLYGIEKNDALDVLKSAVSYMTKGRMKRFMNIEGRIRLFTDKFGLKNDNSMFAAAIQTLFQEALNSIENEDFLRETATTIRSHGWLPPV